MTFRVGIKLIITKGSNMSLIEREHSRKIVFSPNPNPYAVGSVISEFGNTKVHITATLEDRVPDWMKGRGVGWITGEYSMLPSSTHKRSRRERTKLSGRTQEIQRLIGRALRSVVNEEILGERTIVVDCDVLVADGGTRTASVSGGYVALALAVDKMIGDGIIDQSPITNQLAAISVGINSDGNILADLNYEEDVSCETDMNIVMTRSGHFVEVQGTAEGRPFSPEQFQAMLECASISMEDIFLEQDRVLS